MIYEPREDSLVLVKWVNKYCRPGMKVLDIGCGSGIQGKKALEKSCNVTFSDNSNEVLSCLKDYNPIKSNLFENIHESFDLIIFNPPYLPEDKDEPSDSKQICCGGENGWELIEKFLEQAKNHLKRKGIILMVFSSLTNKEKVNSLILKNNFIFRELEIVKLFFEELYIYELKLLCF